MVLSVTADFKAATSPNTHEELGASLSLHETCPLLYGLSWSHYWWYWSSDEPPYPTHTHTHGGGGLASWLNRHPMKCFWRNEDAREGGVVTSCGSWRTQNTDLLLQRHFENCNFTRPQYRRLQGLHSLLIYNCFHFMTLRSAEVRPLRLRFWSSFNVIMSNAEVIVTLFHLVS